MVVNIIQYLLIKYNKTDVYKFICIPFLIIHLLLTIYLKNTPLFLTNLNLTRNAILFGLPLFGIGYLIGKKKLELSKKKIITLFLLAILFFVLQILEDYFYLKIFSISSAEFYICSVVSSALFVCVLTNLKSNPKKLDNFYKIFGKKYSFYLYIMHIVVANSINGLTGLRGILLVLVTIVVASAIFLAFRWTIIGIKKQVNKHKLSKLENNNQIKITDENQKTNNSENIKINNSNTNNYSDINSNDNSDKIENNKENNNDKSNDNSKGNNKKIKR